MTLGEWGKLSQTIPHFAPSSPFAFACLLHSVFRKTRGSVAEVAYFDRVQIEQCGEGQSRSRKCVSVGGHSLAGTRFSSPVLIIKINQTL